MELCKYLIFLPIFLLTLTASSASKSVTEITIKPPSSKLLAKLMGLKKTKPKSKSKFNLKSSRLPRMGLFGGPSYHSMMDDQLLGHNTSPELMGLFGGSSRLSNFDNSPIYYVRLPPTPYMYTPGLGYLSSSSSPISSSLRTDGLHGNALNNPFMNLPINFLTNGQPNGAYEFGMPELMSNAFPGKGFLRHEPQIFGMKQFFDDSPLSSLKGRFDFNGRADGLYMLPDSPYYQSNKFL